MRVFRLISKDNLEQVGESDSVFDFLRKYRKKNHIDIDSILPLYKSHLVNYGEVLLSKHASVLGEITILKA